MLCPPCTRLLLVYCLVLCSPGTVRFHPSTLRLIRLLRRSLLRQAKAEREREAALLRPVREEGERKRREEGRREEAAAQVTKHGWMLVMRK